MYTASKWTQQQEYHFSFYEILVSEALAMQIGLILKNSCEGNKLTKYSQKTYKCMILWHGVPNIVWGENKKFRRQRRKKRNQICRVPYKDTRQSSDFAVCHRELTAKLRFCRVPTVRHSEKNHFAVCFFVALGENSICRVLNFCREFFLSGTRYILCLPCAHDVAHGKEPSTRQTEIFPYILGHVRFPSKTCFASVIWADFALREKQGRSLLAQATRWACLGSNLLAHLHFWSSEARLALADKPNAPLVNGHLAYCDRPMFKCILPCHSMTFIVTWEHRTSIHAPKNCYVRSRIM